MNEETSSSALGPLMKAARKFKKYNQADVARAIGCSQSALSKMEHNLLTPSAPQWFLFARFTAIPVETLETGIIDRHSKIKFNSSEVSLGFKIPKKYRQYRAQKVRELYPFVTYIDEELKLKREYMELMGIDEEFFLDFDNLINYQFLIETMEFIISKGFDSLEDIAKVVGKQDDLYWNNFFESLSDDRSTGEVLEQYSRHQIFLQMDFQLQVEEIDNKIHLSYYPEYHLRNFLKIANDTVIDYINNYRKLTLEGLIQKSSGKKVEVSLTPQIHSSPFGARFVINEVR